MSKADRDRQALLQRLAREQRRALNAAARDADRARTPRTAPTPRRDDSPPSRTSEQPSAQSAARLKSLTPLYKQRQQRRSHRPDRHYHCAGAGAHRCDRHTVGLAGAAG